MFFLLIIYFILFFLVIPFHLFILNCYAHQISNCPAFNKAGAPNVNFRKISVRKMIWDLEFSEHLLQNFLLPCLS